MPVLLRVGVAVVGMTVGSALVVLGARGERVGALGLVGLGVAVYLLLAAVMLDLERAPSVLRAHLGLLARGYAAMVAVGVAGAVGVEVVTAHAPAGDLQVQVGALVVALMAAGMRQAHGALIGRPLGPVAKRH